MDLKEMGCENVGWLLLSRDGNQGCENVGWLLLSRDGNQERAVANAVTVHHNRRVVSCLSVQLLVCQEELCSKDPCCHHRYNIPHICHKLDVSCRKSVVTFHFCAHAGATSRLWSVTLRSIRMITN
jgi:hypothetical protein